MDAEIKLTGAFWEKRWENGQTGWDIGYPSPSLIQYVERSTPKSAKILIPGAGNAYEAEYLYEQGWTQVHVLDIAEEPLTRLKTRKPNFPADQLFHQNFFAHQGQYDLVLEQTFFCALDPVLRPQYVQQMANLLKPGGKLAGLLFRFPLTEQGPPFGGSPAEYRSHFTPYFEILQMETATHSIKPRSGMELSFELEKK